MSNVKKDKPIKNSITQVEKLKSLVDIGIALSSEKELHKLIELVLEKSLAVTGAEGASAYLIEKHKEHRLGLTLLNSNSSEKNLRFYRTTNRRSGFQEPEGILEVNPESIAGYSALNNVMLNIPDVYNIPETEKYKFNRSFDEKTGYKTTSILTIPLGTAQGKVHGVLQLINKLNEAGLKEIEETGLFSPENVIPFSIEDEELMKVITSQATVTVDNSKLTESIESLFESFVYASVKAIESRDTTTSGHSDRVAVMTVELAIATHRIQEGPYKFIKFSEQQLRELRYASLLHDFGKIGIKENVLLKQKKLNPQALESILLRLDSLEKNEETKLWKNLTEALVESYKSQSVVKDIDTIYNKVKLEIEEVKFRVRKLRSHIIQANEPQVVNKSEDINKLITSLEEVHKSFGKTIITEDEIKRLSIPKGSLTDEERLEIESHVTHTYDFLKQIAWTEDLTNLVEIAHCHHEKLDGTGYPRRLTAEQIPVQSKMMTIADIYDALTSFDRPYKDPLTPERAIAIMERDCLQGKLDYELLKIFVEAGVFLKVSGMMNRKAS